MTIFCLRNIITSVPVSRTHFHQCSDWRRPNSEVSLKPSDNMVGKHLH